MNRAPAYLRFATLAFALGGACLLGAAVIVLLSQLQEDAPDAPPTALESAPTATSTPLVVFEPERNLGALPCGEDYPVVVRISNANPRPLRVLGAAMC